ncbi:hypothetical protein GDO81_002815 [Engystomops pustulosus]|uniref:Uncharacterized protein n=1 Tax=Engystomops pustulosus TaxID=76066 RepID=A0AAV7DN12_ENGPU|nr:hypothetical protein GDO81_002815 [Engystomops pustulosus]
MTLKPFVHKQFVSTNSLPARSGFFRLNLNSLHSVRSVKSVQDTVYDLWTDQGPGLIPISDYRGQSHCDQDLREHRLSMHIQLGLLGAHTLLCES